MNENIQEQQTLMAKLHKSEIAIIWHCSLNNNITVEYI